jgi:hypothetical protein
MNVTISVNGVGVPSRWVAAVAALVGLTAVSASITRAASPRTHWSAGDKLSAIDLNANFDGLDSRIAAIEMERVERATVLGGCTAVSQSGSWMTLVRNGPGDCTVVFTPGVFSAAPTCVATSYGTNGAWPRYGYVVKINNTDGLGNPGASGVRVRHMSIDTITPIPNGQTADEAFGIVCSGPR